MVQTMAPHSIGSGTISFGLVSIPVRLFTAASPASVSFKDRKSTRLNSSH